MNKKEAEIKKISIPYEFSPGGKSQNKGPITLRQNETLTLIVNSSSSKCRFEGPAPCSNFIFDFK